MIWLVLLVVCPLLLLLLFFVWKKVADADLTLLWKDQFGLQPGQVSNAPNRHSCHRRHYYAPSYHR